MIKKFLLSFLYSLLLLVVTTGTLNASVLTKLAQPSPWINVNYYFHGFAGNQISDDDIFYDISGAGNDAAFGANLGSPWGNSGYVSTEDPTGGSTDEAIRLPNMNFDYDSGEILIGWWFGKITPEGAAVEFIGSGGFNTSYPGWSIRVNTNGKPQIKLSDASGTYFSGSASGVTFDGNLHSLGFVIDGQGRRAYIWVDDTLDANFSSGSLLNSGNTIDTVNSNTINIGTSLPSSAASTAGIVVQTRALVLLRLPSSKSLPSIATITAIFQALRRNPSRPVLSTVFP